MKKLRTIDAVSLRRSDFGPRRLGFYRAGIGNSLLRRPRTRFVTFVLGLDQWRRLRIGALGGDDQAADHGIVEAKGSVDLVQHVLAALNIHEHVVRLVDLTDGISELATSPIFKPVDAATARFDHRAVTLDHRG